MAAAAGSGVAVAGGSAAAGSGAAVVGGTVVGPAAGVARTRPPLVSMARGAAGRRQAGGDAHRAQAAYRPISAKAGAATVAA